MSAASRSVRQPGSAAASGRLVIYQRYAELVAQQEVALAAGDLEAFDEISRAALELQATVGMTPAVKSLAEDPEAGSAAYVERVADLLRSTLRRNQRIQGRLVALRKEAGQDIHRAAEGRPRARTYVENGLDVSPSLDVTF